MNLEAVITAPPIRSRRRESESRRIVKVALSAFLERGLDQVTAEEIADAAGISRRTFFRYFPSKDDVLALVHQQAMHRVAEAWRSRPLDEPFVTALINASRTSETGMAADEKAMSDLSTRLLLRHPEAWERIVRQVGRGIEIELESVIAFRLKAVGKDASSASALAALAWCVGCTVFRQWLASGATGGLSHRLEKALSDLREAL